MIETAIVTVATFFATIGPLDVAAIFAALTADESPQARRSMALRGTLIASVILVLFALVGELLLAGLGISLAALRTAGGILLLLMGIDLVFARSSGGLTATDEEKQEAVARKDISVFPLATPLIAGPGSMGAAILLMANTEGELHLQAVVVGAMLVMMVVTLIALLLATQINRILGVTGMHVISRVFGVLLTALAVQFIFDGIARAGCWAAEHLNLIEPRQMKKIIIITLLFAAMLNVGKVVDYFTPLPDIALSDNHEVVMYGTSWCSYCAKARKLFDRLGVAYIEYDIEKSEQARGEYDALGGRGTPLLVINKTLISGYDRKAILAALK